MTLQELGRKLGEARSCSQSDDSSHSLAVQDKGPSAGHVYAHMFCVHLASSWALTLSAHSCLLVPSLPSHCHVSPQGPQPQSSCWHRSLWCTVAPLRVLTRVLVSPPGSMVFLTVGLDLLVLPGASTLRDTRTPSAPRPLHLLTCCSNLLFPRDHTRMHLCLLQTHGPSDPWSDSSPCTQTPWTHLTQGKRNGI